jgi:hypothetical protein
LKGEVWGVGEKPEILLKDVINPETPTDPTVLLLLIV